MMSYETRYAEETENLKRNDCTGIICVKCEEAIWLHKTNNKYFCACTEKLDEARIRDKKTKIIDYDEV